MIFKEIILGMEEYNTLNQFPYKKKRPPGRAKFMLVEGKQTLEFPALSDVKTLVEKKCPGRKKPDHMRIHP